MARAGARAAFKPRTPACPRGFSRAAQADLFRNRVENYVRNLVSKRKPKRVLVCMVYFLDEKASGSWADMALSCLCYDLAPHRLQAGIRAAFEHGTRKIRIPGVEVVPVPLFDALDGKSSGLQSHPPRHATLQTCHRRG